MRHRYSVAACLLASATACSSTRGSTASNTPRPPLATSASATPSSSPSATAADAAGKPLGTEQTATDTGDGVTVRVTASKYQVVTLGEENQELQKAGTKVGLVAARMCIVTDTAGQGVGLSWTPWSALTAGGAAYTPPSAWGTSDWPGALYPNDSGATYHAGTCRSGLIPFVYTGPDQPVTVEYNVQGIVLDWRVR